ncbi:DUF4381 domain-containing protein [Microbulbifer flavimaris]|uniref:DUF4381 domain-containing protein n=2 Tax=Microbulbiferaceae TaxID=1706373 RepID=A0ABX4I3K5_9GAMM|nr:hypothetical protein AVO43_04515 [Microbulbifer sp. ZGT114]PCO07004.1 DUF4381 domain-containing protein [Microbulbifer flavimaris]
MQQQPPQVSPVEQALLDELRDIHPPEAISWWPPAPGWWLLAALLIAALYFLFRWLRQRKQRWSRNRYRKEAERLLREIDIREPNAAQEINEILKRVAVTTFGRPNCGNLTGREWLDFLRSTADVDCPTQAETVLLEQIYRTDRWDEQGNSALRDFGIQWSRKHRRDRWPPPAPEMEGEVDGEASRV